MFRRRLCHSRRNCDLVNVRKLAELQTEDRAPRDAPTPHPCLSRPPPLPSTTPPLSLAPFPSCITPTQSLLSPSSNPHPCLTRPPLLCPSPPHPQDFFLLFPRLFPLPVMSQVTPALAALLPLFFNLMWSVYSPLPHAPRPLFLVSSFSLSLPRLCIPLNLVSSFSSLFVSFSHPSLVSSSPSLTRFFPPLPFLLLVSFSHPRFFFHQLINSPLPRFTSPSS